MKCFAIDCLFIPAYVRQLTISKVRLVCKLRAYCRNSISSLSYLSVNSLWRNQHPALLESRATIRKSNALRRIRALYAVGRCAVTEFRALCLAMNALCRSAAVLLKCVLIVYIWPDKGVYLECVHYSPFLFKRQSVQSALWEECLIVRKIQASEPFFE